MAKVVDREIFKPSRPANPLAKARVLLQYLPSPDLQHRPKFQAMFQFRFHFYFYFSFPSPKAVEKR
ncbi:MAG: hypothetical protein JWR22_2008 [Herminiimonas sp.]|nr:hypothetical protein [Herminiimonas sp.]